MSKQSGKKIVNLIAILVWVLSFILTFLIEPGSSLIWLPDGLLLAGFYLLLIVHGANWLWLVFGFLNFSVGLLLLILPFLPDDKFQHIAGALTIKHHLMSYHPAMLWIAIAFLAILIGLIRLIIRGLNRLAKRKILKKDN